MTTKSKQTETGEIPEGCRVNRVGALCQFITSGGTPSRHNVKYWIGGDIPWIKTQELCDGNIYDAEEKINANGLKNSSARIMPVNTVSMAMYGATVGKLGILKKEMSTNQACCNMVVDENNADYRFVYYSLLKNRAGLISLASGAAQQNLNQEIIKNYELLIPPLNEQRAIAKILSDLDDKIELNQKMNKTLEAVGQALFKHWFVDFEFPNEKGKPYKSSGGKMVESELGKIPGGWIISTIGNEFQTILGGTPSTQRKEYWTNGNIPWINSGKVNEFRITKPTAFITKEALENSAAKMMPKGTTVLAITGATLGQVSRVEIDVCGNQSIIGVVQNKKLPSEYVYYWIRENINDLISHQTGGAQQHINKNNVNSMLFLIPLDTIIDKFRLIIENIFQKISLNCFESENLSEIRDSLLPRLMSGKIRVKIKP